MTEEAIKSYLKSYSELKARKDILDKIQQFSLNTDNSKEYAQLVIKIQVIESVLEILTEDEKQIILLHVIHNAKWTEIEELYEKQVGTELNYSNRTFKRIQKNALKKIEDFILENKLEQYIN